MRIKSYFARTVEDAMAMASQELGPDAMLINSRRAPVEARHLGDCEVVFATETPGGEMAAESATGSPAPADRLSAEMAILKAELEGIRRALTRSAMAPSQWVAAAPGLLDAYSALTAGDFSPELAREIVQGAEARAGLPKKSRNGAARVDPAVFQAALVAELESRIVVDTGLAGEHSSHSVVALVGPPGSGKTTTLVKLAVNYGLSCRRPILLLSMDTYRIAAADQLRSYAAILGVNFQVLQTVGALAQSLEENRGKELILIDTPGFGSGDIDNADSLAHFLSTRSGIDTQLVVPASMKPSDLSRVVDAFGIFQPRHLLFSKLDETGSYGPIFTEAARTSKPLSFLTTGQRIPEDLEAASRTRLVELVLGRNFDRAASAA